MSKTNLFVPVPTVLNNEVLSITGDSYTVKDKTDKLLYRGKMVEVDSDLILKSQIELMQMLTIVRDVIREHRDARGQNRCQLNNHKLYQLLPDIVPYEPLDVTEDVFLAGCKEYYKEETNSKEPSWKDELL